jgi:hypothetical protein
MPVHIRVGGVWKSAPPKVRVSGTWRSLSGAWIRVSGVWKNCLAAGGGFGVAAGSYEHAVFGGTATCTLTYNSNGTCSVSGGVSPSPANWHNAPAGGVGSGYEISFDGAAYQNLGTARSISISKSVGVGTNTTTIAVVIRVAGGGATVASGSVTLNATRDA